MYHRNRPLCSGVPAQGRNSPSFEPRRLFLPLSGVPRRHPYHIHQRRPSPVLNPELSLGWRILQTLLFAIQKVIQRFEQLREFLMVLLLGKASA